MPQLVQPNPWMILPFLLLLGLIALAPLFFGGWWGRHYPKLALALGAAVVGYYFFGVNRPDPVFEKAGEYFGFITLVGSLYIVSGGIHLSVKGEATPHANVGFLLVGALASNLLGTTGASMLLIRPWMRMNKYRVTGHHVVFFIFIISNVGGCLTPIGDPPLFLGYLLGIPFWWVAKNCWPMWAVGLAMLLAIFYCVDRHNYLRAPKAVRDDLAEPPDAWRFQGLHNLFFLALILAAVFVHRPRFLREFLMIAAALGSYFTTPKPVHEANHFNLHPIKEVAILFAAIFATMIPALDWLMVNAPKLGLPTPGAYYFGSGILSSVLDNAPTYLSFLNALFGNAGTSDISVVLEKFPASIVAISVGSVFFGANTYIGNGPNFMVKAIADHQKVHTPGFLGYICKFSLPFMVPTLVVVWLIFFRN